MLPYRTVLFDFDYTLGDSSRGIVTSVNAALTALNYPVPKPEDVCQTIGLSLNETFIRLTGCPDLKQAARFTQLFRVKADAVMVGQTDLYPGVREMLEKLQSHQIRTGIVTTKYHYRIDQILARFGAAELINTIVGAEDVNRPKPDPQGIYLAMRRLESTPETTLYVGDSVVDALAARQAGIAFAAVLTGTTPAEAFQAYHPRALLRGSSEILTMIENV